MGGLLVKGWGLLTHGLSSHLEPLLCPQEGLQPAWARSLGLALPGALAALASLPDMPWPFPLSLQWYLGAVFTEILGTNLGQSKTHPHLNMQASASSHISFSLFQDEFRKGDLCPVLTESQPVLLFLEESLPNPQQKVRKFGTG